MSVIRRLTHCRVRRGFSTAAGFLGHRRDDLGGIETNGSEGPYRDVSVRRLSASIISLASLQRPGYTLGRHAHYLSSSVFRQRISGTVTSRPEVDVGAPWEHRRWGFRSRSPGLSGTPKA